MFKYDDGTNAKMPLKENVLRGRKQYYTLKLGLLDKFAYSCWDCFISKKSIRRKKAFADGLDKLDNALDTRTLIKNQRALRTIISLILEKPSRKLINMQRRTTVITDGSIKED